LVKLVQTISSYVFPLLPHSLFAMRSLGASVLIAGAQGHGWMSTPLSRASLNGCSDDPSRPDCECHYFCASHQATSYACDLPCGDCVLPHEGGNCTAGHYPGTATPKEPYCNPNQSPNTEFLETPGEIQASYTAGDTIEVAWVVSVNHYGSYQYRLCLDGSDTEECFKKTPLRFEDGASWHELPNPCSTCTGDVADHGSRAPLMKDRVVIPSDAECDRCTLSWRWDAWSESTIFTSCADVSISSRQATPAPTPPSTPAPTPPTTGGQCCYGGGCSSCNGAGEWCSSSRSACEGSCGGSYCSGRSSLAVTSSLRKVMKHE